MSSKNIVCFLSKSAASRLVHYRLSIDTVVSCCLLIRSRSSSFDILTFWLDELSGCLSLFEDCTLPLCFVLTWVNRAG